MSGGFTPTLKTVSDGVTPEASVLASEHGMVKRVGVTIDASTVPADSDGNKIVKAGTVLAKITATGKYGPYDPTQTNVNEVQTITPGSVSFTLTFEGETTSALNNTGGDLAASAVDSALEGLSTIGAGNVAVTGSNGGPYTVTFGGDLAATDVPLIVSSDGTVETATPGEGKDGRDDPGDDDSGVILESVNCKDGDVITGILLHGSVLEARCTGVDATVKSAFAGRIIFQ